MMLRRMTFVIFVFLSCLAASLIAAPLPGNGGKQQNGNEIGSFILMGERPSQSKLRTVSRREETDSMKDSDKEEAKAENGLLQSIFGAFLAFPNYVAVGLEGLLNGVVGKLLGNGLKIKTSDSEDFR